MDRPSVFSFLQYREFLGEFYNYLKKEKLFTARQFAKQVGFGSPSYLKALIDKKRSLLPKTARQVGRRLGLTREEADFFEGLVYYNDAKNPGEKDEAYKRLLKFKRYGVSQKATKATLEYFSNWYLVAILEGLGTSWVKSSLSKMAEDLGLTKLQVAEALKTVETLDLIEKKKEGWVRKDRILETPREIQELGVREFHREMIKRAAKAVDELESTQRYLGGITVALNDEGFAEFKSRLFDMQVELGEKYAHCESPKAVFQLNLQLFPLFKI